jgi:hypothetical protein
VDAGTVITSVGGAVGGLAGLAALVGALTRRRVVKADAAETVTDTALELMTALKSDAKAAREDSAAARLDAQETHRQMSVVRQECEALAGKMRRLVAAIHEPLMTIEQLRAMVPLGLGSNGRHD